MSDDDERAARLRDMVEAVAFCFLYYESHRLTGEWPYGDRAASLREDAAAVADTFEECAMSDGEEAE